MLHYREGVRVLVVNWAEQLQLFSPDELVGQRNVDTNWKRDWYLHRILNTDTYHTHTHTHTATVEITQQAKHKTHNNNNTQLLIHPITHTFKYHKPATSPDANPQFLNTPHENPKQITTHCFPENPSVRSEDYRPGKKAAMTKGHRSSWWAHTDRSGTFLQRLSPRWWESVVAFYWWTVVFLWTQTHAPSIITNSKVL